jgi:hypothetical protein
VVDKWTKFAHFFAIPSEYKTTQVIELFFKEVFKLHGLLRYIVSDKDNRFISAFLAVVVQVSRYRVDTEHQLSSIDR